MELKLEAEIKKLEREDKDNLFIFAKELNEIDKLDLNFTDQMLEYALAKPEIRDYTFLAYCGDKLAAIGCCMNIENKQRGVDFQIVVHPNHRKKGIGSKMYDMLYKLAKDSEAEKTTCFVKERMQDSVCFAQKRGFEIEKYYWKMELELNSTDSDEMPVSDYSIRKAEASDITQYIDIMNAGFKKQGDDLYQEKDFNMLFSNPNKYVFFIEQDGKIISTAAIGMQEQLNRGYIHNVTVYSDYRGRGFGEITLKHCVSKVREAGFNKAVLNVDGKNKNALDLYKKLGFVEVDTDLLLKSKI